MTQARWLVLLVLWLWPLQATGGPWPRGEGNTFLSYSIETEFENGITDGDNLFGTLYVERGITPRLTLGLDAGGHAEDFSKVIGFLRWPIDRPEKESRLAAEIGAGYFEGTFAIRPGLSWGKGLSFEKMSGWTTIDTRATLFDGFDTVIETDFTIGLKPTDRSKVIFQLQTSMPSDGTFFAKIAPSYVHEFKPGRHLELGVTAGVLVSDDFNLNFGMWREF